MSKIVRPFCMTKKPPKTKQTPLNWDLCVQINPDMVDKDLGIKYSDTTLY